MRSPLARTMNMLKKDGWLVQKVEQWNPFSKTLHDLYGTIDAVAIKEGTLGVFGIQVTSGSNVSSRIQKSLKETRLKVWLSCGNSYEVQGWRKAKAKRGGKRVIYKLRRVKFTYDKRHDAVYYKEVEDE